MSLLLCSTTVSAQTELPPKEEYRLVLSASEITIAKGQRDSVKLSIQRSRSFKNGKATIAANSPKGVGVTVTIKQDVNHADEYIMYLSATPEAKAGEYNFVPGCTLRNKTKGIALKLTIK